MDWVGCVAENLSRNNIRSTLSRCLLAIVALFLTLLSFALSISFLAFFALFSFFAVARRVGALGVGVKEDPRGVVTLVTRGAVDLVVLAVFEDNADAVS